ncbi:extracellular solute-binding protein [Serratia sp. NPDC078756]
MGYQINAQAQSLRASKNSGIALILPSINAEQYHQLYCGLQQSLMTDLDLYVTGDIPSAEQRILQTLAAKSYQTVITVSCLSESRLYYQALRLPAEQILFVYRHPEGAQACFSLDFAQAGADLATAIALQKPTQVGVFCDPLPYANSHLFVDAVKDTFINLSPSTQLTVISSPAGECHTAAFSFFTDQPPQILIAMDCDKTRDLTQAAYLGSLSSCPPIWQLCGNDPAIVANQFSYQMDYARLGAEIAGYIEAKGRAEPTVTLTNRGFALGEVQSRAIPVNSEVLNMLILPSPSTDALKKLLPHFTRQSGIKVNLAIYPYAEIFDILSNLSLHPHYDLLRIDMACFPWLAERTLRPLADINASLLALQQHFSPEINAHFSQIDGKAYGLPFDASTQLLFYRRDLFEDPTIKRMFYEKSGKELAIPNNFTEFDAISAFFTAIHQAGDPQRPLGSSTMLSNSGLIATEFLLRYYALGGRLAQNDLAPRLEPEIATNALRQYLNQLVITANLNSEWWDEPVALFEQGQLAMLIMYMNLFNDVAHSPISPAIGSAPVPGGVPQMGGGSLGMSRFSQKNTAVTQFFHWLYSPEITTNLVLLGGNSAHQSIYQNQRILHQYPWLEQWRNTPGTGIRETHGLRGERFNLRLAEFIIGQGITNVVNNIMTPEQAIIYINQRLLNETLP